MDRVAQIREAYKRQRAAWEEWALATRDLTNVLDKTALDLETTPAFTMWLVENDLDDEVLMSIALRPAPEGDLPWTP